MYDQQQGELLPENELNPEENTELTPEQETELITEQESRLNPEQKSESFPDQESEQIPELSSKQAQKKKKIRAKKLELITDPEELENYKHYEYSHITRTKYDYIFSPKRPQKTLKKKPEKVKQLEIITDPEELENYKHYEYSHIVGTKYGYKLSQKPLKKSEKKTKTKPQKIPKKKAIKAKHLELNTDPIEFGESRSVKGQKPFKESEKKSEMSEKSIQKKKPEDITEVKLVPDLKTIEKNEKEISSENSKKTVEKISDKTESEHSREIKDEASKKEVQTQKPISISKTNNPQNQKSDHKTRLDLEKKQKLMERYRQETGKRPLYAEKETKGFLVWLERQKNQIQKKKEKKEIEKPEEDWEAFLKKWVQGASDSEIPEEIKKELLDIIQKYRYNRNLYWKLIGVLKRATSTKNENEIIENLVKKLEKMTHIQMKIFRNLRAFQSFYNKYIVSDMERILKEREKFVNHLAQKLVKLKKIENGQKIMQKNWRVNLYENLYKMQTLTLKEKSLITKIIQKDKLAKEDLKQIISILSKLSTENLVSLFGHKFKIHTKNYVKWGWDFYRNVKMDILRDFFLKRKSSVLRDLDQWNLNKEVSYTILEEVVHNVIDEYFSQLKKRTKQLSLGKPFVMLRNKKMIDTYLNRKLYNYIGILYKIKDKVTGKYYYGITRNSMKKRWEAHKTNTKAINMNKASLDYFIYELIQKLIKQGFSVDQAMLAIDNRFERIPLEIAFDIFTLIDRERTYIKYAKSYDPKNCFNIALGGALRGVILVEYIDFKSLAYYLAKGYNPKQIAKETGLSKYTVYRSINLIWGGWYEALDLLLKPTVEKLIKKGYDRKYIAGALSSTDRNNYKRLRYRLTPDTLETWCCERWWPDCNNWTEVQKRFLKEIFDSFVIRGLNLKKIDKKFRNLNYQQIKYRFRKMYRDDQGQGLAAARRILIKPLLENALKNKLSDAEIIKILELENWLPFGTSNQKITDANRLLQRLTEEIYFTIYFKKQNYQERIKYFYGDTPTNLMRIFFETGLLNLLV